MIDENIGPADGAGLLAEAQSIAERWTYRDRVVLIVVDPKNWVLYLSTGGWSENESIIDNCSTMFHVMCWQTSRRGGHHVYGRGELAHVAWESARAPWPDTEAT